MADDEVKGYEISDMDVLTVGLVEQGAVGEEFFLLKADADAPEPEADGGSAWERVRQFVQETVRQFLKSEAGETPGEEDDVSEEVVLETAQEEEVTQEETVVEVEPVEKQDTVADAVAPEVTEALAELQKANDAMRQRLEKAEQVATAERDKRERREWLEKARAVSCVPVKADELAEQLHYLAKTDDERAEWWVAALKAVSEQLRDAGLFAEAGTSQTPDEGATLIEKAEALVKEGKAEDVREALLQLPADEAADYLRSRRKALREV
jgi:hypothetical protein